MGIWLGPRGSSAITRNDFSYSGNYLFNETDAGWELALLDGTDASLVWHRAPGLVDLFLVAGGKGGGSCGGDAYGGKGGNGGECKTILGLLFQEGAYTATVGSGGKDSSLSSPGGTSYIAQTGQGAEGGRGSQSGNSGNINAGAGADGVLAFGGQDCVCFAGRKFGAGAGGAGSTASSFASHAAANGGETGAGKGGSANGGNGSNGGANTGSGGGGAGIGYSTAGGAHHIYGSPGTGGSGIIIIRSART